MKEAIRRYLRKLWASHGGGFYGFVAAATFLYLEAIDIAADVGAVGGMSLDLGSLIRLFVESSIDAFLNSLWALLWPVTWIDRFGVGLGSAALLGILYVGYLAVRPAVQRLLGSAGAEEVVVSTDAAV